MNKKLIVIACMTLALAGCGDKNDEATGEAEPSMMEQAGDMASDAADTVKETVHEAAEDVAEMTESETEQAAGDDTEAAGAAMGE